MSIPVLTFFNNKGGVGTTSLVYHLSWMFSELGKNVLAIDLDPQANLTSAFLPDEKLEEIWAPDESNGAPNTIYDCLKPLTKVGDILTPLPIKIKDNLHLVPGDLNLAGIEDLLSQEWPNSLGRNNLYRPFRLLSAFWQVAQRAASETGSDLIVADVGPNLGAINRSALLSSDFVVIPSGADLFSLQGLRNLGPTLKNWRSDWSKRLSNWSPPEFPLPQGKMNPIGYIVQQHIERLSRPVKAYQKWAERIPDTYRQSVLDLPASSHLDLSMDDCCLARLKHFRSLVPLAQEARKPIFQLTPAEGALGNHAFAVADARKNFSDLAKVILSIIDSRDFNRTIP